MPTLSLSAIGGKADTLMRTLMSANDPLRTLNRCRADDGPMWSAMYTQVNRIWFKKQIRVGKHVSPEP
jgi:hypothetical protein